MNPWVIDFKQKYEASLMPDPQTGFLWDCEGKKWEPEPEEAKDDVVTGDGAKTLAISIATIAAIAYAI